ncbi:C10 family peptidase [Alistipes sp.]|uniref:C10 family peptidase n=1 Tax=Alistipes sp. TaxID=1872444 RepID=UPI003AF18F2B
MKKLILFGCILLLGAGLMSCEKDGTQKPEKPAVPQIEGAVPYEPFVNYEEACQLAQIAIDMLESDQKTRTAAGRSIDENRVVRYTVKATRSEDPDDTLLYVFNFDGGGFAVVATDRRVNSLLAVVDEGSYTPVRKTPRNVLSGFDLYMNASLNLLEGLRAIPYAIPPQEPGRILIKHMPVQVTEVEPMIPVKWGTEFPYNGYCPMVSGVQAPAGYAATAIAQIMTAYTLPKTMQLTYSGADAESVTFNWPGILQHIRTLGDKFDCPEHRAIAQMCREIGQQLNTIYDKNSSTADFAAIPGCLNHFGFAADPVSNYSYEAIRQSYENKGMVCMRGTAVDSGKTTDHVWVVDGIWHNITDTEIWFIPDSGGKGRLMERNRDIRKMTHCNWGFEGDRNGYYNQDIFDTAKYSSLDKGSTASLEAINFTQSLKIITGIKPQQ